MRQSPFKRFFPSVILENMFSQLEIQMPLSQDVNQ
jgi:hypothetical protein